MRRCLQLCRCRRASAARHVGAWKPTHLSSKHAVTTHRPLGSRPRGSNAPAKAPDVGRPAAAHKRKPSAAPGAAAYGAAKPEGERAAREGRAQGAGKRPQRSVLPRLPRAFMVCCRWKSADLSLALCRRFQALLYVFAHLCLGLVDGSESARSAVRGEAQALAVVQERV